MGMTSLVSQVEKIYRHSRQGSIGTRREYRKCMLRFVNWLELEYNMQNLRNISNKHLAEYVRDRVSNGNSPGYIMKDLSAIRYYHDQLLKPRYQLERENSKLGVPEKVSPGNRAWTEDEYNLLCALAVESGSEWIADVLILLRELGCRIHEIIRLDTVAMERGLRNGFLEVKGKGGKHRTIVLTSEAVEALCRARARVKRGAKLFVPETRKSHRVISDVQKFIRENRPERTGEQLTPHGLRYKYAQKRMGKLLSDGSTREKAEKIVSRELGHERRRVVRGYLG